MTIKRFFCLGEGYLYRLGSVSVLSSEIHIVRHGIVDYQVAWNEQRKIHAEIAENNAPNTLILLEHPSVYTAGRRTENSERPKNGIDVVDVDRGGKITWHGPGQIVGYPIIRLAKRNEVVGFVRLIEEVLIDVLKEFGIVATQFPGNSGVWIRDQKGDRKIAAIGIRVAKGVTMHGFALNVNPDLTAFNEIIACGLPGVITTSMALELGRAITIAEVTPILEKHLLPALARVSA